MVKSSSKLSTQISVSIASGPRSFAAIADRTTLTESFVYVIHRLRLVVDLLGVRFAL